MLRPFYLFLSVLALFAFRPASCDEIPPLNKSVYDFARESLGKKIGRGECWDLAAQALNNAGATWDGAFGFGRLVDPKKECVYPGDVIQFEKVRVQYRKGNTIFEEEMDQHTAIVYEVKEKGSYVVAEQNTSRLGKKVGLNDFSLDNVKKGKVQLFRPVKK